MVKDLGCSHFQALLALGVFPLGFAVVPLVTAPISEDFGRKPLYVYSAVGFAAMMVLAGLAKNIETVIVARFFQGAFASPGTTMVGGMWETRASVLLTRIAKKMREETGDPRYRSRAEDEKGSMLNKIYLSCSPGLLCTEPVVISMTLWIGLAWGIVFCIVASISSVFQTLHGFNVGQTGSVYVTLFIGTLLGFATNLYQEKLYHRYYAKRGPEARLHTACFAAFLVPIGMLIYAWTSYSNVHWIAQAIGLVTGAFGPPQLIFKPPKLTQILVMGFTHHPP
ncbi:hypothetical protein H0H93_007680 [Arthromyces matolae]|nr:hypothetical protein H0H93_007680 [Arthromyces matolae]